MTDFDLHTWLQADEDDAVRAVGCAHIPFKFLTAGDRREQPDRIAIAEMDGVRIAGRNGQVVDRDQQTGADRAAVAQHVRSARSVSIGQMCDEFRERAVGRPRDLLFAAARRRSQLSRIFDAEIHRFKPVPFDPFVDTCDPFLILLFVFQLFAFKLFAFKIFVSKLFVFKPLWAARATSFRWGVLQAFHFRAHTIGRRPVGLRCGYE